VKKIEAIIQPFMMSPVLDALHVIDGVSGITTSEVHGLNMRALATYERHVRLKLEIVVSDDLAGHVAETIRERAHTGHSGDGHVFILDVAQAMSIRSAKTGTTDAG
jgi:nitrogen regulatory protein PII